MYFGDHYLGYLVNEETYHAKSSRSGDAWNLSTLKVIPNIHLCVLYKISMVHGDVISLRCSTQKRNSYTLHVVWQKTIVSLGISSAQRAELSTFFKPSRSLYIYI